MPEGDTILRAARRVGAALGGRTVEDVWGSARELARFAARLRGTTVTDVRSHGKHHLITFDDRIVLRTHMGMTGSWRTYARGEQWNKSRAKARVVIETADSVAVCFAAPETEIGSVDRIERSLSYLGPDLLGEVFDADEAAKRSLRSAAVTVADLVLDQRVMAGVGNVYKCEILFLEGLHPSVPAAALDLADRVALATRARDLLMANRDRATRSTTGSTQKGRELYVYDRARRSCRVCGSGIRVADVGDPPRVTYWCPRCQPGIDGGR